MRSKKHKYTLHHWLIAIVSSLVLLMASYFIKNIDFPLDGTETGALKNYYAVSKFHNNNASECGDGGWLDSILLINGCYDIDTIPHYFDGLQDGYYSITNRKDIYKSLCALRDIGDYKYVILDIAITDLPEGHNTYTDSIVSILHSMPNVIIAKSHLNFTLADSTLSDSITGHVDYFINPNESGFSKFDIIGSLPLTVYENLYQRKVKNRLGGIFYTDNYTLIYKSFFPSYFITQDSLYCRSEWGIQRLTADLADVAQNGLTTNDIQGKIVVIGDFYQYDIHSTFAGDMSGPLILLNTLLSLEKGYHKVNGWCVLLLFVLYTLVWYLIVEGPVIWTYLPLWKQIWRLELVQLVFELIGWSTLFYLLSIVLYRIGGFVYNPFIPALWFAIVPKIYLRIKEIKNK